jgi:hypothetical protein
MGAGAMTALKSTELKCTCGVCTKKVIRIMLEADGVVMLQIIPMNPDECVNIYLHKKDLLEALQ